MYPQLIVFFFLDLPSQAETGLGSVEYQAVADAIESTVENDPSKIRGRYVKFTDAERYEIGKCAAQNGNKATIKGFKSKNLKESTVRTFKVK